MTRNLEDYIKVIPNFLSEEKCTETIHALETFGNLQPHYSTSSDGKKHYNKQDSYTSMLHHHTRDEIMNSLWYAIRDYTKEFGSNFWDDWKGYTDLGFHRYVKNQEMYFHCDHVQIFGDNGGIPIISLLGILNDDYEGGELTFFDDYKVETNTGDLTIFPSNFMYPHKVTPVTQGERYSFISWVW